MKKENGITLVEILIVISITSFITISLLSSFLRSKLSIHEVARIVVSDVRTAQANALASKQYNNTHRCGYGLYWVDSSSYYLYSGQDSTTGSCSQRHFNTAQSTPIILTRTLDPRLEILNPQTGSACSDAGMLPSDCPKFEDTYFESPNGHIYINQQHQPNNQNNNRSQFLIRKKGASCPSKDCAYICVYSFGRVGMRTDGACPSCQNAADNNPVTCQQW